MDMSSKGDVRYFTNLIHLKENLYSTSVSQKNYREREREGEWNII